MTWGRLGLASVFAAVAAVTVVALAVLGRGAPPVAAVDQQYVTKCQNGTAVPDHMNNPGLVQDCANLLAACAMFNSASNMRDPLDWAESKSIYEWEGITTAGSPARVTKIELPANYTAVGRLRGRIPPEIGNLSELTVPQLSS